MTRSIKRTVALAFLALITAFTGATTGARVSLLSPLSS